MRESWGGLGEGGRESGEREIRDNDNGTWIWKRISMLVDVDIQWIPVGLTVGM